MNYANYSGIIPHIFANCLFSFAFLLFPSLTCLSFFSSSRFLSFYPYLRSFRLSSFISPELYSGIGSFEPPYIDQAWSIPRLTLSPSLPPESYSVICSRDPRIYRPSLVDLPSFSFFVHCPRMTFGYTTTAAKQHFFFPYCKKKSLLSCKYPIFFVSLQSKVEIHPRIALRDNIFNNKHYYYFAFEKKKA